MTRKIIFAGGKTGRKNARSINIILSDYKQLKKLADAEAVIIMQEAAEILLKYTEPHVPYETGALRKSGRARIRRTKVGVAADVSYGGDLNTVTPTKNAPKGIVDYAIIVHEDVTGTNYKVGGPKYLEKGAIDARPKIDNLVQRRYTKLVKKIK